MNLMHMNEIKNYFAGNALLILIKLNFLNLIKKVLLFTFFKNILQINIKNKIIVRKKNIMCKI